MTTDIGTLIERVEAATGDDRDIDGDLAVAFLGWSKEPWETYGSGGMIIKGFEYRDEDGIVAYPPDFTLSIDAAVRLIERVRGPGNWSVSWPGQAAVFGKWPQGYAYGNSAPLSLILALLHSLKAKEERNG